MMEIKKNDFVDGSRTIEITGVSGSMKIIEPYNKTFHSWLDFMDWYNRVGKHNILTFKLKDIRGQKREGKEKS